MSGNPRQSAYQRFKREWDAMWEDENLDRRRARKEQLIADISQIYAEDQAPLVASLRLKGFQGNSVWDLVNTGASYPELIGTLEEHATRDYLDPIKEGIFRALTVRESGASTYQLLVREWQRGIGKNNKFLRWALANAISHIAKRKQLVELAPLMDGDEYWDDPFVRRLKRSDEGRKLLAARQLELTQ